MGNLFPLSPSISFPFELFASQQGFTLPSPDCHAPFCAPVDCVNIDADRISLWHIFWLLSAQRPGISGLCWHPLVVSAFGFYSPALWVDIYISVLSYDCTTYFLGPAHKRNNPKSPVVWTLFFGSALMSLCRISGLLGNAVGFCPGGELWAQKMLTTWENPID